MKLTEIERKRPLSNHGQGYYSKVDSHNFKVDSETTSLGGSPKKVLDYTIDEPDSLRSWAGGPVEVVGTLKVSNTKEKQLKLKDLPRKCNSFEISYCDYATLEGMPTVNADITVKSMKNLSSLKGLPKGIKGMLTFGNCDNLTSLEGIGLHVITACAGLDVMKLDLKSKVVGITQIKGLTEKNFKYDLDQSDWGDIVKKFLTPDKTESPMERMKRLKDCQVALRAAKLDDYADI